MQLPISLRAINDSKPAPVALPTSTNQICMVFALRNTAAIATRPSHYATQSRCARSRMQNAVEQIYVAEWLDHLGRSRELLGGTIRAKRTQSAQNYVNSGGVAACVC
jgi:hypothetical protein